MNACSHNCACSQNCPGPCVQDFEWDQVQQLALRGVKEANASLLQQHASESFSKRMLADSAQGSEGREQPG